MLSGFGVVHGLKGPRVYMRVRGFIGSKALGLIEDLWFRFMLYFGDDLRVRALAGGRVSGLRCQGANLP